jgi:hypothetical protein
MIQLLIIFVLFIFGVQAQCSNGLMSCAVIKVPDNLIDTIGTNYTCYINGQCYNYNNQTLNNVYVCTGSGVDFNSNAYGVATPPQTNDCCSLQSMLQSASQSMSQSTSQSMPQSTLQSIPQSTSQSMPQSSSASKLISNIFGAIIPFLFFQGI